MVRNFKSALVFRIRVWLTLFIVGLVLSGVTAFPLKWESGVLMRTFHVSATPEAGEPGLNMWLRRVHDGIAATNRDYPFMAYGTDWLAFGHLAIAIAFIGPLLDPVRNKWVLIFGLIACFGVFPLAMIAGAIRGIPLYWRLIDCGFGVFGAVPLIVCLRHIKQIENSA